MKIKEKPNFVQTLLPKNANSTRSLMQRGVAFSASTNVVKAHLASTVLVAAAVAFSLLASIAYFANAVPRFVAKLLKVSFSAACIALAIELLNAEKCLVFGALGTAFVVAGFFFPKPVYSWISPKNTNKGPNKGELQKLLNLAKVEAKLIESKLKVSEDTTSKIQTELVNAKENVETEKGRSEQRISELETELTHAKVSFDEEKDKANLSQASIDKLEKEKQELETNQEELVRKLAEVQQETISEKSLAEAARQQYSVIEKRESDLKLRCEALEAAVSSLTASEQNYKQQLETKSNQYSLAAGSLTLMEAKFRKAKAAVIRQKENKQTINDINRLSSNNRDLTDQNKRLREELEIAQRTLEKEKAAADKKLVATMGLLEQANTKLIRAQADYIAIQQTDNSLRSQEIQAAVRERMRAREAEAKALSELEEKNAEIAEKDAMIKKLEAELAPYIATTPRVARQARPISPTALSLNGTDTSASSTPVE